jgi:hypothetical protein
MSGARSEGKPWLQDRSGQHIDLGKLGAGMCQPCWRWLVADQAPAGLLAAGGEIPDPQAMIGHVP